MGFIPRGGSESVQELMVSYRVCRFCAELVLGYLFVHQAKMITNYMDVGFQILL